ncbi:MAG: aldehyde dehydrogenase family protein [Gemmataceae bacterium]
MTLPFAAEAAACRSAQSDWSRRSVAERLKPIRALRHLFVERASEISDTVRAEIGRPEVEVIGSELLPTAAAMKFLEREAAAILRPRRVGGAPIWLFGSRDTVHRRPWGVVGIIGTWNYPIFLNVVQTAHALVAGNGVLWKPSEVVPRTADLTHRLFLDAGFPAGLFRKLPATREGGTQLAEADVDHVVFTGSDRVGRKLAARLGERLIPSTLELSGIDAMFVLDDADVDLAAKAAWFGFTLNAGQTCIAVRRIFVHRSRVDEFTAILKSLLDAAPLKTLANGKTVRPVLQAGIEAEACREVQFSPVAALIPFDSIDTAMSLAAESRFGLSASIFSKNIAKARELAARIRSGSLCINDALAPTAHPGTPFGGRGDSGWGVMQGREGLLGMTVPQVVTVRKGTFRPHFDDAANPDPATARILSGLLKAAHARGIRSRLHGVLELIRGVRRRRK